MLQCIAVCCSVLLCVAVGCIRLDTVLRAEQVERERGAVCCSVLQCGAVCCSVLRCVASRRTSRERGGGTARSRGDDSQNCHRNGNQNVKRSFYVFF